MLPRFCLVVDGIRCGAGASDFVLTKVSQLPNSVEKMMQIRARQAVRDAR
jgi:hypothetical protein